MRPWIVIFMLLFSSAAHRAHAATTAPATVPATAPAGQGGEILRALENLRVQPAVSCKWRDLVRVTLRDGRLELESHPPKALGSRPADHKSADLEIEDAAERFWRFQLVPQPQPVLGGPLPPGGALRINNGRPAAAVAARPRAIDFDFVATPQFTGRFPAPFTGGGGGGRANGDADRNRAAVASVASVAIMAGTFRLGGRVVDGDRRLQVAVRSYVDKSNVSLLVRDSLRGSGRRNPPGPVLSFDATSVTQLRREHPAEVRRYLEPLLSELGGGTNPLRPQPGDVFRALPSVPADSAMLERVRRLVAQFDELEPATRECASRELETTGRAGVLAAARIDRRELSAEQATRLDAFIARHSTMSDVTGATDDRLFLCDCLADDDRAVRAAALDRLRSVVGATVEFDLDATAAQRDEAAATLAVELLTERH
jgi:hypothetical protein